MVINRETSKLSHIEIAIDSLLILNEYIPISKGTCYLSQIQPTFIQSLRRLSKGSNIHVANLASRLLSVLSSIPGIEYMMSTVYSFDSLITILNDPAHQFSQDQKHSTLCIIANLWRLRKSASSSLRLVDILFRYILLGTKEQSQAAFIALHNNITSQHVILYILGKKNKSHRLQLWEFYSHTDLPNQWHYLLDQFLLKLIGTDDKENVSRKTILPEIVTHLKPWLLKAIKESESNRWTTLSAVLAELSAEPNADSILLDSNTMVMLLELYSRNLAIECRANMIRILIGLEERNNLESTPFWDQIRTLLSSTFPESVPSSEIVLARNTVTLSHKLLQRNKLLLNSFYNDGILKFLFNFVRHEHLQLQQQQLTSKLDIENPENQLQLQSLKNSSGIISMMLNELLTSKFVNINESLHWMIQQLRDQPRELRQLCDNIILGCLLFYSVEKERMATFDEDEITGALKYYLNNIYSRFIFKVTVELIRNLRVSISDCALSVLLCNRHVITNMRQYLHTANHDEFNTIMCELTLRLRLHDCNQRSVYNAVFRILLDSLQITTPPLA